jgi:hypothetical protein
MDPNTGDLLLLEAVKRADPAFVSASEYFVLKDSIPHEVREAIETLILRVKYIKMHQQWCMIRTDWLSYKNQLIAILMTRMTRRSLELGKRGPTPDDLGDAPMLSSWIAIKDPQCGGAILVGLQTGHPFLKGRLINTSRLCGIDPGQTWARTVTRWYRLYEQAKAETLGEQLGEKTQALKPLMLEFTQVQDVVARDQADAGFSGV